MFWLFAKDFPWMLFQKGPCLQIKDGSYDVGGDKENVNEQEDDVTHRPQIPKKEGTIDQIRRIKARAEEKAPALPLRGKHGKWDEDS